MAEDSKKLSAGLLIGIIIMPIFFSWFVLRHQEYPQKTRRNTLIWLVVSLLAGILRIKNAVY